METLMRISLSSARKLFCAIDTPRALTCEILVRYGEWDQLATLRLDPSVYTDARAYYLDCLATEFLRKHRTLPTSYDKAREAESKFWDAERLCAISNVRFKRLLNGDFESSDEVRIWEFILDVKKELRTLLSGIPEEVFPRFGPGATFDDRGLLTTVADKMVSVPSVSDGARCFLELWKHTAWGREYLKRQEKGGRLRSENSDRFTTVPKDSKTDRSIAIQPSINVFYQLGVGDSIRNRLRKWGINLNTGQTLHRQVACEASASGLMSTIDLSSASDTISKEVVRALLPSRWHLLLSSLRTTHTTVSGRRVYLEKFSAMGNGFTFELETAIFASLVKVTLDRLGLASQPGKDFHVYGDDIIVPVAANSAVLSVLEYFGFVPNPRKTFSDGSFRESCGGDFFDGQPVRAHYLKDEPNEPHEIISLANGLRRCLSRLNRCDRVRGRLIKVWHSVLDLLPVEIRRLRGPESLGDLVIHDDRGWDTRCVLPPRGTPEMQEIRVWQPVSRRLPLDHWPSWCRYAGALYGIDSTGITPRGAVAGYRRAWVALLERLG
jgi:hypothetical protein